MMQSEIIATLKRLGYLRNTSVTWENIDKWRLTDHEIEIGLGEYQKYFAPEYERIAIEGPKGEPAEFDGKFGPITGELLNMERCGCPDFHDHENPLCAATAEANWPGACRGNLKFGRTFASLPGLTQAETDLAFDAACRSLTRALGDVAIEAVPYGQPTDDCQIVADAKGLGNSTLAWSYLARNDCRAKLAQAYNSGMRWNVRKLITVAIHEIIHAFGGPHVNHRSATEFPSIHSESLARFGWLHAADVSMLKGIGYEFSGLPQPDDDWVLNPGSPDPDPEPEPDPDDPKKPEPRIKYTGEIITWVDGKAVAKMRGVPSIEIF